MIKLKEIICCPSPTPPPPPHIRFKYCPLHSLHLICHLNVFNVPFLFAVALALSSSLSLLPCPLLLPFADTIVVAIAHFSSAPVPITVFLPSLYVAPTRKRFLASTHWDPSDATS